MREGECVDCQGEGGEREAQERGRGFPGWSKDFDG